MSLVTYKELLDDAYKRKYCVGMFDALDFSMAKKILGVAEQNHSPVILATAEGLMDPFSLEYAAPVYLRLAKEAKVPVCVFLDHGYSYEIAAKCAAAGFTGVMIDGSSRTFEENVAVTADVVKFAHALGCSVEAELGHVGGGEDSYDKSESVYTDPAQALEFVRRTGVDALAVAIGSVHGVQTKAQPLDIKRLAEIRDLLKMPLVMHGGSGLPEEEIKAAVAHGICKINIYTDMLNAYKTRALEQLSRVADTGVHTLEFCGFLAENYNAMGEIVFKRMETFGSIGKA